MSKIDFDTIENIEVDCIVGFGATCRVAKSLQRNNLRYFASPFDWQMSYDLDVVIKLLKNKGKTFFNKCYEELVRGNNKIVRDENGMCSLHDFPKKLPIEIASKYFYIKYNNRFKTLNKILKRCKIICIMTNRDIKIDEMENFIDEFTKLYSFKHLYYINVFDTKEDKEFVEVVKNKSSTLIRYCFNDEHKNGRDSQTNSLFWLGNVEYWDKILKKISINKSFKQSFDMQRRIFNIRYDMSRLEKFFKVITIFGIKFKFKVNL